MPKRKFSKILQEGNKDYLIRKVVWRSRLINDKHKKFKIKEKNKEKIKK